MSKKISELPATTTPTTADLLETVQSSASAKITRGNFLKNVDADGTTSDVTTNNVTSTKHGYAPKSPADATQFLNGAATPAFAAVKDSDLSTSDITTNDASTSKHGFLKKLDNNAAHFMDGQGNWSTPAGGVTDASSLTYTPASNADWTGSADPGNTDDALDQLADRVTTLEGAGGGSVDASGVTYTPASNADWNSSSDPGNTDDALDQLADRVTTLEGAGGGSADHAYYTYLAAQIEPLAIEKAQTGAFSYSINSSTTKLIINAYNTQLGATGRWEIRDPRAPMPLRNVTLAGLAAGSMAVIIDPSLPTYTDARTTYFDRLNTLATTSQKYFSITGDGASAMFLPGPYGNIITSINVFDVAWMGIRPYGSTIGWNLHDENGDAAANSLNYAHATLIPLSKNVCALIQLGTQRSGGAASGSFTYIICPSSWGKVTDSNSYIFRDDFTGASLDTGSTWTRNQSTAGNVEINTAFAWCKAVGNNSWGANGARSQATTARANGKVFMCDLEFGGTGANDGLIVGWNDGGGNSYTNIVHGLNFNNATIHAFENSNDRGAVGSGFSAGVIYRIRITLGASNNATYEIQGGTQYAALGGSSWTDITPGTSSSSTTPLAAGFSVYGNTNYVGDVRLY